VPAQAHNHQGNPTSYQPEGQKQRGGNVTLWGRRETWSSQGQPRSGMLWHILVKQGHGTASVVSHVTVPRICHFTYMLKDWSFWQLQVEARRCTITLSFTSPLTASYPLSLSPSSATSLFTSPLSVMSPLSPLSQLLHSLSPSSAASALSPLSAVSPLSPSSYSIFYAQSHFPDVDIARNRFFSVVFMFSYFMNVHSHFVTFRWFCQVLLADYTLLPSSTLST